MSSRAQASREAMSSSQPNLKRAVWIHQREGVDYGPFTTKQVAEEIYKGDLDRDDFLVDQATNESWRVGDVRAFERLAIQVEGKRRKAELEQQAEQSFQDMRKSHALRPLLFILLAALLGVGGWHGIAYLSAGEADNTAFAAASALPAPRARFAALEPPEPEPVQKVVSEDAADPEQERKARKRKKRRRARRTNGGAERAAPAAAAAPQSFDFTGDEIVAEAEPEVPMGPRPLAPGELRMLRDSLRSSVRRCTVGGSKKIPAGRYEVVVAVDPSGKLGPVSLQPTPAGTETVVACLSQIARAKRFRAFTGRKQKVTVPVRIDMP
jgi:hypothetical protein